MSFLMSHKKGFTLIELLVAISIVAILASVIFANVQEGRKKAHDAKRVSDMQQLQLALRLYKDANGTYPVGVGNGDLEALNVLVPGYLPSLPNDPLNNATTPNWDWSNQNTYYYWSTGYVGLCGPYPYTLWYRAETRSAGTAETCVELDSNSYTVHPATTF